MFLKEIIEVGGVLKAQTNTNFSNIPVGMGQEGFRLPDDPVRYMLCRGFVGYLPDGPVEVVAMDRQVLRVLIGRFQF